MLVSRMLVPELSTSRTPEAVLAATASASTHRELLKANDRPRTRTQPVGPRVATAPRSACAQSGSALLTAAHRLQAPA